MALILKPNKSYLSLFGTSHNSAYLICSIFERNDKNNREQIFYVNIYNSRQDRLSNNQPIAVIGVRVTESEYDEYFSPAALEEHKNLHERAYIYLLEKSLIVYPENQELKLFAWLQGNIWEGDE